MIEENVKKCTEKYLEIGNIDDLKGRPIIAGPTDPTHRLSSLLDSLLKPLVPGLKSYIKDDWDIQKVFSCSIPFDCKLYTLSILLVYIILFQLV